MMSGPFPPPVSTKSNSLTRGVSPSEIVGWQENQRITDAHGVIQQIISNSILEDESSVHVILCVFSKSLYHILFIEQTLCDDCDVLPNQCLDDSIKYSTEFSLNLPSNSTDTNKELEIVGEECSCSSISSPTRVFLLTLFYICIYLKLFYHF